MSAAKRPPHAICLVIDGLHAGYWGAYGNAWLPTPHWDRLASEAFLFDSAFVDSPRLEDFYRAAWRGRHSASANGAVAGWPASLPVALETAGVDTVLITDDPAVAEHELADGFGEAELVSLTASSSAPWGLAAAIEETALAQFFAEVIDRLDGTRDPFLLWAHCGALGRIWDAPRELREALLREEEDEDEGPLELSTLLTAVAPHQSLPPGFDPDQLLGWRKAYAAQISVLDRCCGALAEACDESEFAQQTLLTILGARGFPLGEHRRLGWCEPALQEELIHVPWLLRLPETRSAADRSNALVQPADLAATLAAWFQLPPATLRPSASSGVNLLPLVRGEVEMVRDRLLVAGVGGERALRTPGWYLRSPADDKEGLTRAAELFVKPDDRWEINEVRNRCADVAAELSARLEELAALVATPAVHGEHSDDPSPLAPLSDEARLGPR